VWSLLKKKHDRLLRKFSKNLPKTLKARRFGKRPQGIGQSFFQKDVFKLQEVFSELEIRVFLVNGLESFQTFLILQISDKPEALKRFQKQF
jgi:hypothetical protein